MSPPAPGSGSVTLTPHMKRLRAMRDHARLCDKLYRGQWRDVLIDAKVTQHHYRKVLKSTACESAEPGQLVEKVNLVRLAMRLHATVLCGETPTVTPAPGMEPLAEAIDAVLDRSHWPSLCVQAALECAVRGACVLVTLQSPEGAIIEIGEEEQWLPMGRIDARGQPEYWERRWTITRMVGREERRYLRVERHTLMRDGRDARPTGEALSAGHVIEQEAYATDTSETLIELDPKKRVSLAEALGAEAASSMMEREATGLPLLPIAWLSRGLRNRWPEPIIPEGDLDAVDAIAAAWSRLSRTHSIHASPKLRVSEGMIDPRTGKADATAEAIVDHEQLVQYITLDAKLAEMLEYFDRVLATSMARLEVSPSLLGMKTQGGSNPDSYEKIRLESTATITSGRNAAPYAEAALARIVTAAMWIEAARPLAGYELPSDASNACAVDVRPALPRETIDIAREQRELLEAGITSLARAVRAVHGDAEAEAILAEIEEDQAAEVERQKAGNWSAVGNAIDSTTETQRHGDESGAGDADEGNQAMSGANAAEGVAA